MRHPSAPWLRATRYWVEESIDHIRKLREDASDACTVDNYDIRAHKPFQLSRIEGIYEVSWGALKMCWERVFKEGERAFLEMRFIVWDFSGGRIHIARIKIAGEDASRRHNRRQDHLLHPRNRARSTCRAESTTEFFFLYDNRLSCQRNLICCVGNRRIRSLRLVTFLELEV